MKLYILSLASFLLAITSLSTALTVPTPTAHDRRIPNGTWKDLPPLPHNLQEHSTVVVGDHLYVLGGVPPLPADGSLNVPTLANVTRYSFESRAWQAVAPMPAPLNHVNAVAHHGRIYVLGGLTPEAGNPSNWVPSNASFAYDPRTGAWTDLPAVPAGLARGSAAMASFGDEIFLAGGLLILQLAPPFAQNSTAAVHAFNTRTRAWRKLPPLPEPRDHDGYALVGHTLYVLGGRADGQFNVRNTTFALDLRTVGGSRYGGGDGGEAGSGGWRSLAQMPTARGGCTAGAVDGVIYVFGGEGNPDPDSDGVYPQAEAYDTRADRWARLPDMPHPRHGTIAAAYNGGVYIPGGGNKIADAATDIFDVYRP